MDKTTRLFGGWGWVGTLVLAMIPGLNLLSLVGAVCVFIAMWRAGEEARLRESKKQLIIAVVLSVAGGGVFLIFIGASLFALVMGHGGAGFGVGMIVGGLVAWACYIVGAWYWYRACAGVALAHDTPMLKTGGLVSFIGALTLILFGIGGLVALVGSVLQAIGFFSAPQGRNVIVVPR